jgi:membrane protease YdiL (CAAX protease family)
MNGWSSYQIFIFWVLIGLIVVPLQEEFICRGFMYPIFKQCWGKTRGMCFTSALFSLAHFRWVEGHGLIDAAWMFWGWFVIGLFLNIIFEREKHLAWNIGIHSLCILFWILFVFYEF